MVKNYFSQKMDEDEIKNLAKVELFKKANEMMQEMKIENQLPALIPEKYHRTKIADIPEMKEIKKELKKKLGTIGIYAVVVFFGKLSNLKGEKENSKRGFALNYRELEKVLILIYQLLHKNSINSFRRDILKKDSSSFKKLHNEFWNDCKDEIDEFINSFDNKFTNPDFRALFAYVYNPDTACGTLLLDGHDTKINYSSVYSIASFKKIDFVNYKLNSNLALELKF